MIRFFSRPPSPPKPPRPAQRFRYWGPDLKDWVVTAPYYVISQNGDLTFYGDNGPICSIPAGKWDHVVNLSCGNQIEREFI